VIYDLKILRDALVRKASTDHVTLPKSGGLSAVGR
jgi:hypothetical protein